MQKIDAARLRRMEANYEQDKKMLSKMEVESIFMDDDPIAQGMGRMEGSNKIVPLGKIADFVVDDLMREIERIAF